jgi:CRP-like cAMP-binding protein
VCAMQKLVEVERSPEWMEAHGSSLSPDSLRVTKVFNVGIFEAGDFFGEEEVFLSGATRQSHCAALTDSDVLEIHFAIFGQFVPKYVRDLLRRISLSRNAWRNARTGALIKSLNRRHWVLSSGQRTVFDQDMQHAYTLAEKVSSGLVQTEEFTDEKQVIERASALETKPLGILFKVSDRSVQ